MAEGLTISVVLLAGALSFLSPCFLPMVPVYVTYLVGQEAPVAGRARSSALAQASAFVLGFSTVFIALWLAVGAAAGLVAQYQSWIRVVGGGILIFLGLHLVGWLRIPALEKTIQPRLDIDGNSAPSLRRSALIGLAFGAGWTPCIGPVLGGVIALASSTGSLGWGTILLATYCFGLGVPFLLVAVFATWFSGRFSWFMQHARAIQIFSGGLLIVIGFLVITDLLGWLSSLFVMPL